MNLTQRIKQAEKTTNNRNCISFALYAIGLIREEIYIHPYNSYKYLSKAKKLQKPEKNSIAAFKLDLYNLYEITKPDEDILIVHMAVITQTKPEILIYHREAANKKITGPIKLTQLLTDYPNCEVEYYKRINKP
ncbi:hypothetical protein DRJ22_00650 [Candidatus Woesearchaeota archaeon]|nr:MAG: hypothetical protein DRJ22_00650 [Candidatus Woesearchaeota archaeon]